MIRETLSDHGLWIDPDRGQHFLDDPHAIEQMIEAAEIGSEETVLEIGAGIGTLTAPIAEQAEKVITYENDEKLIGPLRDELAAYENVDIRAEDALKAELPDVDKCVSNIPYQLSSSIIELLGEHKIPSVLMVQKEFADRLTAAPGSQQYSRITVRANYHFVPVHIDTVPKHSFFPEPQVNSAIVKLFERKDHFGIEDEEFFFMVVKALFVHRNKKTRNAFYNSRHMFDLEKDAAKALRDEIPHADDRVVSVDMRGLAEITSFLAETLHPADD